MPEIERTAWRRLLWLSFYLVLSVLAGTTGVVIQPVSVHYDLAKFFAGMAATLFAILGVWIAVLDPRQLLKSSIPDEAVTDEQRLVSKLLGPWLSAIATFAVAVFCVALLALLQSGLDGGFSVALSKLGLGVNILLMLLIMDALVGTLVPIAYLRHNSRLKMMRKMNRS